MPTEYKSHRLIILTLGVIVLAAFVLRVWGLDLGLPDVYHPDEERLVHHALAFGLGDFNPHYFNYPSLTMYMLFGAYALLYVLGRIIGIFGGVADFQKLFFSDPSVCYLVGRAVCAVLGAGTVFFVYLLGKKCYGKAAGVAAAGILAITFLHAENSHFIATDIPLTFFVAASFIFIVAILRSGRIKAYVWAGLLAGLGAASKYNAATLALPIFLAHWWNPLPRRGLIQRIFDPRLLLAACCMLLAFFIGSPFCIIDFPKFWKDFTFISEHMKVGVYSTGGGRHWADYFILFFRDRIYFAPARWNPLGLLYIGGVVWAIIRGRKMEWLLLTYPLLYFFMVGSWGKCNPRYLIPVFPPLAVLAGRLVGGAWETLSSRPRARWAFTAAIALLSIVAVRNIVLNNIMLSRIDTRWEARRWVEENIPAGEKIALEWDNNATIQLQETDREVEDKIKGYQRGELSTIHHTAGQMAEVHKMRLQANRGRTYDILRFGEVKGLTLIPYLYSLEELKGAGARYLVVSSLIYNWFMGEKGKQPYPRHAAFYEDLFRKEAVKIFQPVNQPGPVIKIYELPGQ